MNPEKPTSDAPGGFPPPPPTPEINPTPTPDREKETPAPVRDGALEKIRHEEDGEQQKREDDKPTLH